MCYEHNLWKSLCNVRKWESPKVSKEKNSMVFLPDFRTSRLSVFRTSPLCTPCLHLQHIRAIQQQLVNSSMQHGVQQIGCYFIQWSQCKTAILYLWMGNREGGFPHNVIIKNNISISIIRGHTVLAAHGPAHFLLPGYVAIIQGR